MPRSPTARSHRTLFAGRLLDLIADTEAARRPCASPAVVALTS